MAEVAGAACGGHEREADHGPWPPAGEAIPTLDTASAWERLWDQFEREFAADSESGVSGSRRPRPGERIG